MTTILFFRLLGLTLATVSVPGLIAVGLMRIGTVEKMPSARQSNRFTKE